MVNGAYCNELDITRVMVCIAHNSNTYDKKNLFDSTEVFVTEDAKASLALITDSLFT